MPGPTAPSSGIEEKAWKRKDTGEQRARGGRRRYLIVCNWGSCGRKDAGFSLRRAPPPHPSPLSVRTHTRQGLLLLFPPFQIPPFLAPFLSFTVPSSGARPLSPCSQRTLI